MGGGTETQVSKEMFTNISFSPRLSRVRPPLYVCWWEREKVITHTMICKGVARTFVSRTEQLVQCLPFYLRLCHYYDHLIIESK